MFGRKLMILVFVLIMSIFVGVMTSYAEDGQCSLLLTTVCNKCHNSDRICAKMDTPETKWNAILDWMVTKGAKLEKDDAALLANCLTEPLEEARKICKK